MAAASRSPAASPSTELELFNEDQYDDILLRLPPHRPKLLVRFALVSPAWRRILADPGFLRRYLDYHNLAPMMGYINNGGEGGDILATFVPTATTNPFRPLVPENGVDLIALDSRHGRVLFQKIRDEDSTLIVWDPVADCHDEVLLPEAAPFNDSNFTAAVLCDAPGCNHRTCHGGPFRVVVLHIDSDWTTSAFLYASASHTWSPSPAAAAALVIVDDAEPFEMATGSLLVGSNLFFFTPWGILEYQFGAMGEHLQYIDMPDMPEELIGNDDGWQAVLMPMGDEWIGFAAMHPDGNGGTRVQLWEATVGAGGVGHWVDNANIPVRGDGLRLVGAAGRCLLFCTKEDALTSLDVGTGRFRDLPMPESGAIADIVPFVSFHTPAPCQASDGDDAKDKASSSASTLRTGHGLQR
ncbi:unnamed protein product [Urochloa decumbens]|uniref:F-box domain-containing protein n=1 Tax=Urochloa decumbens TaxID=240449 RepID=A0ABC9GCZ2_9POAL